MSLFFNRMSDDDEKRKKFQKLDEGDINGWILNQAMAPNPLVRYLTSMMYLSNVTGLSRINYPNSAFMKGIKFERLFPKEDEEDKPFIFHNAWNLDKRELALFSNRRTGDKAYQGPINASTLCACSALPFVEETVKMGGDSFAVAAGLCETLLDQLQRSLAIVTRQEGRTQEHVQCRDAELITRPTIFVQRKADFLECAG